MIQCVSCGSSQLDAQGVGCAHCGGSPADRSEQCHINEYTRATILQHAERLRTFGITLKELQLFAKVAGANTPSVGLALDFSEPLDPATLRSLVLFLFDRGIRKQQIFRLRLGEPEEVSRTIDEGVSSLRQGEGKLTKAFRLYVRNLRLLKRGSRPEQIEARKALQEDLNRLLDGLDDEPNWDDADRRVYEILVMYEDQELPV